MVVLEPSPDDPSSVVATVVGVANGADVVGNVSSLPAHAGNTTATETATAKDRQNRSGRERREQFNILLSNVPVRSRRKMARQHSAGSNLHNLGEVIRVKTRSPNQGPIHIRLRHEFFGRSWLHRTPVLNSN